MSDAGENLRHNRETGAAEKLDTAKTSELHHDLAEVQKSKSKIQDKFMAAAFFSAGLAWCGSYAAVVIGGLGYVAPFVAFGG